MSNYNELIRELQYGFPDAGIVQSKLIRDAIDAIEQLCADVARLEAENRAKEQYISETIGKVIKERDAAIADLTNIVHDMGNTCICDYCIGCVSNGFREGCKTDDGDRWEWRGAKTDEVSE